MENFLENFAKLKDAYQAAKLDMMNIKLAARLALNELPINLENRAKIKKELLNILNNE